MRMSGASAPSPMSGGAPTLPSQGYSGQGGNGWGQPNNPHYGGGYNPAPQMPYTPPQSLGGYGGYAPSFGSGFGGGMFGGFNPYRQQYSPYQQPGGYYQQPPQASQFGGMFGLRPEDIRYAY